MSGSAYSPRDWLGELPFPWPPTLGLADGETVVACFSVNSVNVGRTRQNAPFLKLQLADAHGVVDARMWDDVDAVADHVRPGSYIGVRGCIETYQDQRQLRIDALALLRIELDDLVLFLPRSARPAERMEAELTAIISSIRDSAMQQLLQVMLAADSETGHAFRLAPAAKQNHHAYLGGLIEHTLSVAHVCDLLAGHYGRGVDRDLLLAGALLHDIGKIREIGARGGFPYTDEGKLLGHMVIGMQMVAEAAKAVPDLSAQRLLLLQHLVASHQGRYEWQSPREPRIIEALLLHYADDLDAKFTQASALLDGVPGGWTAYDRSFARDFLRHAPVQPEPAPSTPARSAAGARKGGGGPTRVARPATEPPESTAAAAGQPSAESTTPGPSGGGEAATEEAAAEPANESVPPLDTLDLFEQR